MKWYLTLMKKKIFWSYPYLFIILKQKMEQKLKQS